MMQSCPESVEPRKTTTNQCEPAKRKTQRRKDRIRRPWSNGTAPLTNNAVEMFFATLHFPMKDDASTMRNTNEHDDDDSILNIGQDVQSHLPDIVLNNLDKLIDRQGHIQIPNEHNYDNVTLLFLDVSGFTSLTEQYSNDAHLGIDQLTRTLNSYFDKLVYEILIHDGDIYKFAGDAILALWIENENASEKALKCALNLQQKCGAYETDVGVILRLKVALAYGSVRALFVGNDEFKHYLLTGDCVKHVNSCEQLCEPGDIIITSGVYDKLRRDLFPCQFVRLNDQADATNQHLTVKYDRNSMEISDELDDLCNRMEISNPELTTDETIDSLIKSFLLHCVYQRIERKQSLNYLSELRRVTISFINLDITDNPIVEENLHGNLQKIFVHIYEQTKMMGGVLTKALMFDKGWSFLCVFGLPGYKQGDDTANALKSAQMIHSTIRNQCEFVDKCSIGVTTGLTYCGVVGHTARSEYTVIGRKVNMAARLMCNYPNIISCDQETCYNSRLNSRFFQILPSKTLKGMNNVGLIWHYGENHQLELTSIDEKNDDIRQEDYPLLGRRLELMIVATQILLLDEPIKSEKRRRDLAAIVFEGDH